MDDLLVNENNVVQIEEFKKEMMKIFEMIDLGERTYFLGMEIKQMQNEVFICQKNYLKEILRRFKIEECKSVRTPMNQKEKLHKEDGVELIYEGLYRSLIRCMVYLTARRPDILFPMSVLSRFFSCASELHMMAAKRVVSYLK